MILVFGLGVFWFVAWGGGFWMLWWLLALFGFIVFVVLPDWWVCL